MSIILLRLYKSLPQALKVDVPFEIRHSCQVLWSVNVELEDTALSIVEVNPYELKGMAQL